MNKIEFGYGIQRKGARKLKGFPINTYNFCPNMKIFIKGKGLTRTKLTLQIFDSTKFITIEDKVLKIGIDGNHPSEPREYLILDGSAVIVIENNGYGKKNNGKKPIYRLCLELEDNVCHYSYFAVRNGGGGKFDQETFMKDLESYIGIVKGEKEVHSKFEELYSTPNKKEEDPVYGFPFELDILNDELDDSFNKRIFSEMEDEIFGLMPSKYTKWD